MCSPHDIDHLVEDALSDLAHDAQESPMQYENLGPVANPDGSPTELTRAMLAGTGRDPVAFATQRWAPICQECYEVAEPTEYFPEATGFRECSVCGDERLTVNVHPEVIRKGLSIARRDAFPSEPEPGFQTVVEL